LTTILILTGIGFALGALIILVGKILPQESRDLKRVERIAEILPGMNCGACSYSGCFAYAQALVKNPKTLLDNPCLVLLQDAENLKLVEASLGLTVNVAMMERKACIHCGGGSEDICQWSGTDTCKGVAQRHKGYKRCPFGCLGLGDCIMVCPQNAIYMNPEKGVAVVDWEKCNGCGLCVAECPQKLIQLVPASTRIALLCTYTSIKNIPGREKCDVGCVHCKKCVRACEHDAISWNAKRLSPIFDHNKCTLCLKCVEACPQNTLISCVAEEEQKPTTIVSPRKKRVLPTGTRHRL